MAKNQRNLPGPSVRDPSIIDNLEYNESSGGQKILNVGPNLLPLNDGAGGYTTDASTKRTLPKAGCNLAIFNTSATTAYSVTVGDSTVTAQAIGVVQTSTNFVGIACPPNTYTYISCGYNNYVITNNNALAVYLINDETSIRVESL